MKLYELSKKTGISINKLKEELGYKSHMKNVPEDIIAEYIDVEKKIETEQAGTETVDSAETVVVESVEKIVEAVEECPVALDVIALSIRCLGSKSKYFKWRHLLNG